MVYNVYTIKICNNNNHKNNNLKSKNYHFYRQFPIIEFQASVTRLLSEVVDPVFCNKQERKKKNIINIV